MREFSIQRVTGQISWTHYCELKNRLTKQNVDDAVYQYKTDRDSRELLFKFARCMVHFAVDDSEIKMYTKLDGKKSWFLPFNKGYKDGAGNPPRLNRAHPEKNDTFVLDFANETDTVPTSANGGKCEAELDLLSNILLSFYDLFGNISWKVKALFSIM